LEFNVPFQHKYGYVRDDERPYKMSTRAQQQLRWVTMATIDMGLKEGGAVPLSQSAGNLSNTMWPAPMSTSVPSGVRLWYSHICAEKGR